MTGEAGATGTEKRGSSTGLISSMHSAIGVGATAALLVGLGGKFGADIGGLGFLLRVPRSRTTSLGVT